MIEFLEDYTTEALPPETFTKGQQVTRSPGSEGYFVGRGLAGYVVDGKLVDVNYRPIDTSPAVVEVVHPGNRRADLAVRAGEVMTGQPPRATSGPGVPFVEPAAGLSGSPSVVLEAEIERLKAEAAGGNDLFREMNNSHVADKEALCAEIERLTGELARSRRETDDLRTKGDGDLAALREDRDRLTAEHADLTRERDGLASRVKDLEARAAAKPSTAEDGAASAEQQSPEVPHSKSGKGKH